MSSGEGLGAVNGLLPEVPYLGAPEKTPEASARRWPHYFSSPPSWLLNDLGDATVGFLMTTCVH